MVSADSVSDVSAPNSPPRGPRISTAMTVGRAALLLSLMVALSRLTGFGRIMLTSTLYGAGPITDAYNAAFNIPDTISIIIAGGALATGFVPVFTQLLAQERTQDAINTFRAMWTLLAASFGIITLILFASTYTSLGLLLAPRDVTPEISQLYLHLLRILLVAQLFFICGGLFSGTLNALRQFWYFALQPVCFNVGIILGGIIGPKFFGAGIESQAWGALGGAIVGSLLIQIPAIYRNGLTLKPLWNLRDEGVQKVLGSLLPIVFGLASGQIIAMNLPRFIATGSSDGELSMLDAANRLMQVPLAVLASGPAIALFPTLSLLAAQNNRSELREALAGALRRTLVLNFLCGALLLSLAQPTIRLLLQHGRFTSENTHFTAQILWCYVPALVALSAQQFLSRGFYALQQTRVPTNLGLVAMLLFVALASTCRVVFPLGAPLLALIASLCIVFLAIGMSRVLVRELGGWDEGRTSQVLVKCTVAAIAAWSVSLGAVCLVGWNSPLQALASCVLGAVSGVAAFLGVAQRLKLQEIEAVTKKLSKLKNKINHR